MKSKKVDKHLAEFGKRLAELRQRTDLTQTQLAEKAGVNVITVGFIEQGRQWPRISTLHSLAKALNVKVEDLFKGL